MTARLTGLGDASSDPLAKAMVMVRESLAPDACYCAVGLNRSGGVRFQRRIYQGDYASYDAATVSPPGTPIWLRMVYTTGGGTGYYSLDGSNWTSMGTMTGPNNGNVYVGLAVTSRNDGMIATATFDNVTITPTGTGGMLSPLMPTNLTASVANGVPGVPRVDLDWLDNANNENSYRVLRSASAGFADGTVTPVAVLPAGNTSFIDTDPALQDGQTYYYRVCAFSLTTRESAYPAAVAATLPAAPIAVIGGAYIVDEGGVVTLDASGRLDPQGGTLSFQWDFNYDGASFNVDAAGMVLSFSAVDLDGPMTRSIALRATNPATGWSNLAVTTLTVRNAAPTATLVNDGPVDLGTPVAVSFANPSDAPADIAAGLRYSYDFNDDGDFTDPGEAENVASPVLSYTFPAAGVFNVRGRITDKDGDFSDLTTSVIVRSAPPSAPVGLATDGTAWIDVVPLAWQAVAGAAGYVIEWSADQTEWFAIDETIDPAYSDEYPILGDQWYRVRAFGPGDDPAMSEASSGLLVHPIAPPVAWGDDNAGANERGTLSGLSTKHDTPLTFDVLSNDIDYDGGTISIPPDGFTQPANGVVGLNLDGTFTYQPSSGFVGTDSFTYWLTDGTALSAPAAVVESGEAKWGVELPQPESVVNALRRFCGRWGTEPGWPCRSRSWGTARPVSTRCASGGWPACG